MTVFYMVGEAAVIVIVIVIVIVFVIVISLDFGRDKIWQWQILAMTND